jgi:hypothetical protein
MDACISGLDWRAALASMPKGLDRDFVKDLLGVAEQGYLVGWWDARPKKD